MSPARDRLLHHELDRRRVDEGQHLLGLRLRRRQEAGAEPGRGDHGLALGTFLGRDGTRGSRATPGRPRAIPPPWRTAPATLAAMPTYEYAMHARAATASRSSSRSPRTSADDLSGVCGGALRKVFHPRRRSSSRARASTPPTAARPRAVGPRTRRSARRRARRTPREGSGRLLLERPSSGSDGSSRLGVDLELGRRLVGWRLVLETSSEGSTSGCRRREEGADGVVTTAEIGVFGGSGFYSFLERHRDRRDGHAVRHARRAAGRRRRSAGDAWRSSPATARTTSSRRTASRTWRTLWAMKELGVTRVIGPNACGSLQEDVKPGDFVICDQLVDRTRQRPHTFYDGPRHDAHLVRRPVLPHDARGR